MAHDYEGSYLPSGGMVECLCKTIFSHNRGHVPAFQRISV